MPVITCSRCGQRLWFLERPARLPLTCSHCLAEIPNTDPEERISPTLPPESVPTTTRSPCLRCGQPLESRWKLCPRCEWILSCPRDPRRVNLLDFDVWTDNFATLIGLLGLALVLAVGIGALLVTAFGWHDSGSVSLASIFTGFLASMLCGMHIFRRKYPDTGDRAALLTLGCLMFLAIPVAVYLLFVVSCMAIR
jgi:hypothetical protein